MKETNNTREVVELTILYYRVYATIPSTSLKRLTALSTIQEHRQKQCQSTN